MTPRLVVRATAEADITGAALWYEQRAPGLGTEFLRTAIRAGGRSGSVGDRRQEHQPDSRYRRRCILGPSRSQVTRGALLTGSSLPFLGTLMVPLAVA